MTKQKRGPSNKFSRIESLGEEKVAVVDSMLYRGTAAKHVAEHIQNKWMLCTDVKTDSLAKQLVRYRREYIDANAEAANIRLNSKVGHQEVMNRVEQFDVMGKLADIVSVQSKRVDKLLKREESMPTLLNQVRQEMKELRETIKLYADLALETGLMRRAPKAVTGLLALSTGEGADDMFDIEGEVKSRNQLRAFFREATEEIRNVIDVEPESVDIIVEDTETHVTRIN